MPTTPVDNNGNGTGSDNGAVVPTIETVSNRIDNGNNTPTPAPVQNNDRAVSSEGLSDLSRLLPGAQDNQDAKDSGNDAQNAPEEATNEPSSLSLLEASRDFPFRSDSKQTQEIASGDNGFDLPGRNGSDSSSQEIASGDDLGLPTRQNTGNGADEIASGADSNDLPSRNKSGQTGSGEAQSKTITESVDVATSDNASDIQSDWAKPVSVGAGVVAVVGAGLTWLWAARRRKEEEGNA